MVISTSVRWGGRNDKMMRLARNDDGLGGQELIMASADDRVIPVILPLPHPGRAACGARESTQIDRCARHTHKPDRCAQCEEHKLIEFQVSVRFSDVVLPSESGSGDDCACSCTTYPGILSRSTALMLKLLNFVYG